MLSPLPSHVACQAPARPSTSGPRQRCDKCLCLYLVRWCLRVAVQAEALDRAERMRQQQAEAGLEAESARLFLEELKNKAQQLEEELVAAKQQGNVADGGGDVVSEAERLRVQQDVENARQVYEERRRKVQALQDEMQTVLVAMLEMEELRRGEQEGDRQAALRLEEELRQLKYREEKASVAAAAAVTAAEEARQVYATEKAKANRLAEEKLALQAEQQKTAEHARLALEQMQRLEENVARTMAEVERARTKYDEEQRKVQLLEEETRRLQAEADKEQAQEQELLHQLEQVCRVCCARLHVSPGGMRCCQL